MMNGAPAFESLSRLFLGDRDKMRRALGVFLSVTRADLDQLDAAKVDNDWATITRIMHKTKSACLQIGEDAAADAAVAVEDAIGSHVDAGAAFATARGELSRVVERVERYLAVEDRG